MHILFLTDNFPPEVNAPASRTYEHALRWIAEGCKVTIITCFPNYPDGKIFPGYRNKWYQYELMDGIEVIRVKTFMTANEGFFLRTLDYLSFMITAFFAGLLQKKPDVIVATSPQFFTAISGWLLAFFRRLPFVFELRDIWPASIIAVGAMKKNLSFIFLEKLELFLYRRSDAIIALTESFKLELTERGIESNKIHVVLNGVDLDFFQPAESKDLKLISDYSLQKKFIVGYIGTLGMAHGLEVVIEAAKELTTDREVIFMLVGSGAAKNKLVEAVKRENLNNIFFIDTQPKKFIRSYFSLCDLSLIHLKNNKVFSKVIPSKIFESMGMGVPILMALPEGEATKIVNDNNCGVVIPPEDGFQLAKTITRLKSDNVELKKYKKFSLEASIIYSRDKKAYEMLEVLKTFQKI